MYRHILIIASLFLLAACSDDDASSNGENDLVTMNDGTSNDGTSNDGTSNDGTSNDVNSDNGTSDLDVSGGDCRQEGDGITTIVFTNLCDEVLYVEGSDIEPATIQPGASDCRDVGSATEELSARRYWGYLGTDPGGGRHTLAEFTFNTDFNDFDWYNISHVDAHNLTMQIVPLDRSDCDTLTCDDEALRTECPEVGQYFDSQGELVACVSPDRDDPQGEVPLHFESCDDGYAWSLDDHEGDDPSPVRACAGEDWAIVFCP